MRARSAGEAQPSLGPRVKALQGIKALQGVRVKTLGGVIDFTSSRGKSRVKGAVTSHFLELLLAAILDWGGGRNSLEPAILLTAFSFFYRILCDTPKIKR